MEKGEREIKNQELSWSRNKKKSGVKEKGKKLQNLLLYQDNGLEFQGEFTSRVHGRGVKGGGGDNINCAGYWLVLNFQGSNWNCKLRFLPPPPPNFFSCFSWPTNSSHPGDKSFFVPPPTALSNLWTLRPHLPLPPTSFKTSCLFF